MMDVKHGFVLLLLLPAWPSLVLSLDPPEVAPEYYETAYACEESQLNITCGLGLHLNVIRANYGRFSIAICNLHGNTDWSVNCMAVRTLRVIRARCQGMDSCHVPVDSTIFSDPCPGTYKYVEVHYSCEREIPPTTTSRPRPPWFPEPPADSWQSEFKPQEVSGSHQNNKTNTTRQIEETQPSSVGVVEITTIRDDLDTEDIEDESTPEIAKPRVIKVKVPKPLGGEPNPEERPNLRIPVIHKESLPAVERVAVSQPKSLPPNYGDVVKMLNFTHYCPPTTARGLYWNWTLAGDTAVLQCPLDSTGFAKWRCVSLTMEDRVEWAPHSPTLAECQSKWLNNLDSRLRDGEAIRTVSGELAQLSGLQAMYGGDLQLSSRMLKHMAERMHYDIQGAVDIEERETMVTELVENVVLTGSNILARVNHMSWADLSPDDVAAAATSLMVGLEENAFLLADAVTTEKIIIKPTTNILLSIRVMQSRSTQSQRFPTVENLENQEDFIEVSSNSLQDNSENGAVRIIFATYNEFDQLLVPSQRLNSSLRFVNSKVISASLGKGRHIQLADPVKITLKHLKTRNVSRPVCVFWDYAIQTWSNEGCRMMGTNMTHTQCECSHLTNFALIMEEGAAVIVPTSALPNHITTIIACMATLVCVTLMMFALVMTWRKFRVSHQCRSMLQKSGIPCFHKTKELSEKDKKQGNFYTVTPKLNGSVTAEAGKTEANIEMDNQQYFEHMIAMQKNQDSLVLNKTMSRRNTIQNNNFNELQETNLCEVDLTKPSNVSDHNINNVSNLNHTLNNKKNFKAKTQCQHVIPTSYPMGMHNDFVYPKKSNASRAMSPLNHIYMEIDPKSDDGTVYEALNQSEAGSRSETYMLSSVSDMSDDDFRRCSDMSRQSSSRYAESKPLIRGGNMDRNLLTTINSVMHSQSVRVANPQHHHRTSILSTISGLRYTDPSQPGQPSLPSLPSLPAIPGPFTEAPPLQVTTTMNGDQFVCLNLNNPEEQRNGSTPPTYTISSDQGQTYTSLSDTYVTNPDLQQQLQQQTGQQQQAFLSGAPGGVTTVHRAMGVVQAPVHSQLVIQRMGTLPRQYAHPLAPNQ